MNSFQLGAVLALVCATSAASQVSRLEPAASTAGSEVRLLYRAAHASLPVGDPVFASVRIATPSGFIDRAVPLRESSDGALVGVTRLPADAVHLQVDFSTRRKTDERAAISRMIVDESGKPVRRARVIEAWVQRDRCLELLEAELESYPDSYSALRTKWSFIRLFRRDLYDLKRVREDLELVRELTTPDALVARTYLSILCGDREYATASTQLAVTQHPTSWAAARTLRDLRSGDRVLREHSHEAVARHPETWLARQMLATEWQNLPFEVVEKVAKRWAEDEPLCPLPDLYLASSSLKREVDLEAGQAAAVRSVNAFLRGDGRVAGRETRGLEDAYVPWGWLVASELAEKRGDVASAIGYAKAYSSYPTSNAVGFEIEGRMWDLADELDRTREAWLRAMLKGSNVAKSQLRNVWVAKGDDLNFEEWLTVELAKLRASEDREKAPVIRGRDLAGRAVDTTSMAGKVVVLNFWSLGCAPCKAEIPQLNQLVDSYSDRPVEFVALAASDRDDVSDYLSNQPFRYRQLIGGEEIRESMKLAALPAHVVVDGRGHVVAKFTGGSAAKPRRLQALIDLALAELG